MGPELTADRLRSILRYDPDTGLFWWREPGKKRRLDRPAGNIDPPPHDYARVRIDGVKYLGHRLAWLYVHGEWPEPTTDHKNRLKHDNRISNLRLATQLQQMANMVAYRNNKIGLRGVHYHKQNGCWCARIKINGRNAYLGSFDDPEEAYQAYCRAAQCRDGEFFFAA